MEMQRIDENGAVGLAGATHDRLGLRQRANRTPAHELQIDTQAELLREVAEISEMRSEADRIVVIPRCNDRHRAKVGCGFEQARERRNIDARCELNELDLVQAHPLAGERPFELTVRVRSHPRRIGRSAGSHGDHAQADEAEAGTRGLGRKRDRRKVQCRQMSKAEIRHG